MGHQLGEATTIIKNLRAMDEHSQRCAQEIASRDVDVVLAGSSVLFGVTGLARYLRQPSVLYLQEPYRELYEAYPRSPWPALPTSSVLGGRRPRPLTRLRDAVRVRALRIQAREELEGAHAYHRVLANSYFSRESILRAYGIESSVCYLGVDTQHFTEKDLERKHLVVGIGAFAPLKRVDVAIEAIARLRSPRPELAWIGNAVDPCYLGRLVDMSRTLGVVFTPHVRLRPERVVELLNEACVMVYAPRLEPFGYAPLEAGACGLPVVAKAEGGVRETVLDGETGFLVDNDEELTSGLQRILDNEALARRMGARARCVVLERWSLSAAIDRLERELLEVVRKSGQISNKSVNDVGVL